MSKRNLNLSLLPLLLVVVALAVTQVAAVACPRCSFVESVVWATDGQKCFVFRNGCLLLTENCGRELRNEQLLQETTKSKCQQMCSKMCTREFDPICAEYNGTKRTFSNQCMLTNHICKTGETYRLFSGGACA